MIIEKLKYLILREFEELPNSSALQVKGGLSRDVVTELDVRLHVVTRDFLVSTNPSIQLFSEEDPVKKADFRGLVLVVDPLDGSNNFHIGLPGYGYMATLLDGLEIIESLVVLPQMNIYLEWEKSGLFSSQPILDAGRGDSAPIYFAYPPNLDAKSRDVRARLLHQIDKMSSGVYRSGAACVGLYHLFEGRFKAFVGFNIRAWDFLAFMPILVSKGIAVGYHLSGENGTIIASEDSSIFNGLLACLPEEEAAEILHFKSSEAIQWGLAK
jgi:myo-inositol-1(or 4)-monophosphatase